MKLNFMFLIKIKQILKNIIFTILGVLFVIYFIKVSLYWDRIDSFNTVMICMGLLWIIVSIRLKSILSLVKKTPKAIRVFFKICVIIPLTNRVHTAVKYLNDHRHSPGIIESPSKARQSRRSRLWQRLCQ